MLPTTSTASTELPPPQLTDNVRQPSGLKGKNTRTVLFFAAAAVLLCTFIVSSLPKKRISQTAAAASVPQTQSQPEITAANVSAMRSQLNSKTHDESPSLLGQGQTASASGIQPPVVNQNGYPTVQGSGNAQPSGSLSPAEQTAQQLAAKERELQFASRFSSNIAWSRSEAVQGQGSTQQTTTSPTNLLASRAIGEAPSETTKHPVEVNVDSAIGQPYVLYEGTTVDTILENRLDGDAAGPVKVLVSNPVYSHDRQHVVIPEGAEIHGEAKKIGSSGFGQQRRMAVVFHRIIMPDGYSVDLDQFHGLSQIGQEGLKDKVNNHYLQIFGTSIALGVVAGAAQITEGGVGYNATGSQAFITGAAAGISQQATTVLDRFIQIPPTITIREGNRIKVYFTQDMLLPAYENHRIAQSF